MCSNTCWIKQLSIFANVCLIRVSFRSANKTMKFHFVSLAGSMILWKFIKMLSRLLFPYNRMGWNESQCIKIVRFIAEPFEPPFLVVFTLIAYTETVGRSGQLRIAHSAAFAGGGTFAFFDHDVWEVSRWFVSFSSRILIWAILASIRPSLMTA